MSQIISFEFLESPKGKERPRASTNKLGRPYVYTPATTQSYEKRLGVFVYKLMIENKWQMFSPEIDLEVDMVAYFGMPKSSNKANIQKMLNGEYKPTRKPDADNIQKIVFDSLNGIVYHDDAQICKINFIKIYDTVPRIKASIKKWESDQD